MLGTPIRDRQAERREATRAEIIAAAWAIAEEKGLAGLTLRDVALAVGMQAPSLYSYFASKNAIYDAMFGQAWTDYLNVITDLEPTLPKLPRATESRCAYVLRLRSRRSDSVPADERAARARLHAERRGLRTRRPGHRARPSRPAEAGG